MGETETTGSGTRLDRWLWTVRLFRTRTLAADACRRGQVRIGGSRAKPSRPVAPGMVIEVHQPAMTKTMRILAVPGNRVGAKLVPDCLEDLTPEEEKEKATRIRRENRLNRVFHVPGQGRPDKRQLRRIRKFLDAQAEPPER